VETGIRFTAADADDVLRWPGVPPMFAFRDPDGNGMEIVEQR
jgi:catechol 2,3-dioxygenase-like lactoylglutathione lyase family enzyme